MLPRNDNSNNNFERVVKNSKNLDELMKNLYQIEPQICIRIAKILDKRNVLNKNNLEI